MGSTPDQERQNAQSAGNAVSQDQQQPKRKGGRKPVRRSNDTTWQHQSTNMEL
jgi:hypothetical protein